MRQPFRVIVCQGSERWIFVACGFLIMSTTFQANVLKQQLTLRQHRVTPETHKKPFLFGSIYQSVTTSCTFSCEVLQQLPKKSQQGLSFSHWRRTFDQQRRKKVQVTRELLKHYVSWPLKPWGNTAVPSDLAVWARTVVLLIWKTSVFFTRQCCNVGRQLAAQACCNYMKQLSKFHKG